ncbi:hypothetical protein BD408DRAFT_408066 [Parasitella parasitica]|nr:hypothetical protein BD408DRAFT_408066 [Parasitella parasitica]
MLNNLAGIVNPTWNVMNMMDTFTINMFGPIFLILFLFIIYPYLTNFCSGEDFIHICSSISCKLCQRDNFVLGSLL